MKAGRFGLPVLTAPHNIVVVPNGDIWAVLAGGRRTRPLQLRQAALRQDRPHPGGAERAARHHVRQVPERRVRDAVRREQARRVRPRHGEAHAARRRRRPDPVRGRDLAAPEGQADLPPPDAKEKALWIATLAGGELLRFDLATNEVENVGCGVKIPGGPLGIATDAKGRLWTVEPFPGRVALVKE